MLFLIPEDKLFKQLVLSQTVSSEVLNPNIKPYQDISVFVYEHIAFADVKVISEEEYYIGYNYKLELVYFIIDVEHFNTFKKYNKDIITTTSISEVPPMMFRVKKSEFKEAVEKIYTISKFISKYRK